MFATLLARLFSNAVGRRGAAAVGRARNARTRAEAFGSRADIARSYSTLESAQRVADRNDMVAGSVTGMVETLDNLTGGLLVPSKFAHTITVSVKGGPQASLRRCWFLCLAALFGRRKRGTDALWAEALNAQWDITGKTVTATLSYATSAITEPLSNISDTQSPYSFLQRGPDQVTIGAGWPSTWWTYQQVFVPPLLVDAFDMVGGMLKIRPSGALNPLAPIPGELTDPTALHRLADGKQFVPLPRNMPAANRADPDGCIQGWKIIKGEVDALQPTFVPLVQPWSVAQITNALAELPIDEGFGKQLLPYRAHAPLPLAGHKFVRRGGAFPGYVPVLPDENRVITTGEKLDPRVQPPKPPVDGVSRGHMLDMVAAALASPGVLVEAPRNPRNDTQRLASQGLFLQPPGTVWKDPDDMFRFQSPSVVGLVKNVFSALQQWIPRGLYAPARVDNVKPPYPHDPNDIDQNSGGPDLGGVNEGGGGGGLQPGLGAIGGGGTMIP